MSPTREDDLVLERRDLDLAVVVGRRRSRPSSCSVRAGTFASSSPSSGCVERGLLDGQPVGVGRDHPQLLAGGRDEHAGEVRPRLVARGRARDAVDRLDERRDGHAHASSRPASGSFGKSSSGSVRRWNFAVPETTSTSCCDERYSSERSSLGSDRTTSSSSRPGTTAVALALRPGAGTVTRMPSSMSVAWSSTPAVPRPGRARRRASGSRCGSTRRGRRRRGWPRTDHMESRTSLPVLSRGSRGCADVRQPCAISLAGAGIGLSMAVAQAVDSVNGRGRHRSRARAGGGWRRPFHVFHQACPQAR